MTIKVWPDIRTGTREVVNNLKIVAWEGLWTAKDLISVFSRTEPFSWLFFFAYLAKLLDFFFDTENKIVVSISDICYSDVVLFYIYISVCLHGLNKAFFSAFYSKQINIMSYFYSCVFYNNERNPSFHEEQLPVIAACSERGWMFSNASTGSLQSKNFMQKINKKQQ